MSTTDHTVTTTTGDVEKHPTEYVVLRHLAGSEDNWADVARIKATSGDQAIRKYAEDSEGTYVAVPARSWNPRTVTVATEKKISLS